MSENRIVGVAGAGSFGTAIANLLAENGQVLLYTRRKERYEQISGDRMNMGQVVHPNVMPCHDPGLLCKEASLIFPTVPSAFFNQLLQSLNPYLTPEHILIHGTKGFNIILPEGSSLDKVNRLNRTQVQTISEMITERTCVIRVGCISGPNLAAELAAGQPAGTVVASRYNEVIEIGQEALRSQRFQVFGSNDLIGVELSGVLKNVIAIASGIVSGLELGENSRALLISKGMGELIRIGKRLGGNVESFVGLAGVGDIIATASSKHSRNYTVGYRLAKGESLSQIQSTSSEIAEGVNTTKVAKLLADHYKVKVPIIQMLYRILFHNMQVSQGVEYLMKYPFLKDVDFL